MFGTIIKYDCTDHFDIYCTKCDVRMNVKNVETRSDYEKCTHIKVECPKCSAIGQRKIYWREE